jgi:hypothetical protein
MASKADANEERKEERMRVRICGNLVGFRVFFYLVKNQTIATFILDLLVSPAGVGYPRPISTGRKEMRDHCRPAYALDGFSGRACLSKYYASKVGPLPG